MNVEQDLEEILNELAKFCEIHLVGSALQNPNPSDIDLVLTMKSKKNLGKKYSIIYDQLKEYQKSGRVSFLRAPSNIKLKSSQAQLHVLVEPDFTWPNASTFTRISWAENNYCWRGETKITRKNFSGTSIYWRYELHPILKALEDFQLESSIFKGKYGYVPCEVNYSSDYGKSKLIKYSSCLFINALIYKEKEIILRREEIPNYLNLFFHGQFNNDLLIKQLSDPDVNTSSIQDTRELLLTISNFVCQM